MNASFTYAIRYWIEATCSSPIRTGNAANDIDRVLTLHTGQAMLQGASIAGAMRAWIKDEDKKTPLFGSEEQEGTIRITDALFDHSSKITTRPRVHIDRDTSTVNEDNKFDIALVQSNAVCNFEIIWLGHKEAVFKEIVVDESNREKEDKGTKTGKKVKVVMQSPSAEDAAKLIEDCLNAIQSGEITFGAQRSNGFGRMTLSVKKRTFDMTVADDRNAWLNDSKEGTESVPLKPSRPGGIVFDVYAHIPSVLIKASAPKRKGKKSIQVHLSENNEPILPGSSLKGAMRAHMQRIAPFLSIPEKNVSQIMMNLMGNEPTDKGNTIAGKLIWTDAKLAEGTGKSGETTRIRINRLTAGTIQGALISEQPVCGDWHWSIQIPEKETTCALLVLYALRDLGLGIYQLGGTKAVGRGTVDKITVNISDSSNEATLRVEDGKASLEDAGDIVAKWETQKGGSEHEN